MLTKRFQLLSQKAFDTQGGTTAGRWAPLSPRYAEWKRRKFPGKTILRRRDRLFKSYTTRRENVAFASKVSDGFVFKYGSTVPYAEYHEKGTMNMPARKTLNPTSRQLTGIAAAMGRVLVDDLVGVGWFDGIERVGLIPGFVNTGFDVVDI